ncbi:MAG TPA: pyridoxal-phosphate dependent enzyme [Longimicrobiales bacterium]|nr:pyridoxal-phosphate dependent enzyme [Longimicrobiales bacterium]
MSRSVPAGAARAELPRFPLLHGPTPLHELPGVRAALGGPERCPRILVKRDDLAGPALGGNKARKLEYVVADALARGATHLVTVGAVQSNHARMTAAAARLAGLGCVLVLTSESGSPTPEGNLLLDRLLGAEVVIVPPGPPGAADNPHEAAAVAEAMERLAARGDRPYHIPVGASMPLGVLGYVDAVAELERQLAAGGIAPARLYFAAGSRGTQAGIVLGARLHGAGWTPHGVAVSPGDPEKTGRAVALAAAAAELLGSDARIGPEDVVTHQEMIGPGYAIPTPESRAAIRLLAGADALLLDPVYTAKAMAGLLGDIRGGAIDPGETVVFLHTGGVPALFTAAAALDLT